jgi:hypothetical protein
MAEAVAAVGLAASIIQLIDFSLKISTRLGEFQSSLLEEHNLFSDLVFELPLLSDTLARVCMPATLSRLDEQNKASLGLVVRRSQNQVERLDKILEKTIPREGESSAAKRWKALCSLAREKHVKRIVEHLLRTSELIFLQQSAYNSQMITELHHKLIPPDEKGAEGALDMIPSGAAHFLQQSQQKTYMQITRSQNRTDVCLDGKCPCSCHRMWTKKGWPCSWRISSPFALFSSCDRAKCENRNFHVALQLSLVPAHLFHLLKLRLQLSWGERGFSMSTGLEPIRVVKFTSPGFEVLWKTITQQISPPDAQRDLTQLFETGQASPNDVNPKGLSLLEVALNWQETEAFGKWYPWWFYDYAWNRKRQVNVVKMLIDSGAKSDTDRS